MGRRSSTLAAPKLPPRPLQAYTLPMKVEVFLSIRWGEPDGPLIHPPGLSPVIADPSFLFPWESPDGLWELFAHSAFGIHRYSSRDGVVWDHRRMVIGNAMRGFARPIAAPHNVKSSAARYAIYFESYPPFALAMTALPFRRRWKSRIAMAESADLSEWSKPKTMLEPIQPWARDEKLGESVSNPCVIQAGGAWRLYFSASLAWIEDCGFCEPLRLGMAEGPSPSGPFAFPENPLPPPQAKIGNPAGAPAAAPARGLFGEGSIKVLPMEDGFIGLQNKIYRDPMGKSRSAIFILRSGDGIRWEAACEKPLVSPGSGWMSSHVYACDCRLDESQGVAYLYFNARDGWRISQGKERIGRLVGRF